MKKDSDWNWEELERLEDLVGKEPAPIADTSAHWAKLYEISGLLNYFAVDYEKVLETIIDAAIDLTKAERGILLLCDGNEAIEIKVARAHGALSLDRKNVAFSRTIVDRVINSEQPLFIPNLGESPKIDLTGSVRELQILSVMCVPLKMSPPAPVRQETERRKIPPPTTRNVIGAIYVDSTSPTNPFSTDALYIFQTLANQATTAILNATLYHEATTDSLTRMYIRRIFEKILSDEVRLARKASYPLASLMLDIDHFKQINDTYGHQMGDEVLREVASIIKESVRSTDVCARYGGEEFAILLPNTSPEDAMSAAEKIRKNVASHVFPQEFKRLTVSVGVTGFPKQAQTSDELILFADQALYNAKNRGRNKCQLWNRALSQLGRRRDMLPGFLTGDPAKDFRNVALLLDTLIAFNTTSSLDAFLRIAVDKMIEITQAERGILMLLNDQGELGVHVARDKHHKDIASCSFMSSSIPEKVARSGSPILILDAFEDAAHGRTTTSMFELDIRSVMCVPLRARGKIFGVMYVDSHKANKEFTETDITFFSALASQAAIAIERTLNLEHQVKTLEEENRRLRETLASLERQAVS